jgi:TolB-like protein/DNA-binding winged helix-turn-helix (wHTH) protein
MPEPRPAPDVLRFGIHELDLRSGELRKNGVRVKLEGQPVQILALLMERRGHLVTREELRRRLWPAGTVVDFEHSINAAVKRLREVLNDSADTPRFIETLPRRGYRFIYPADDSRGGTRITSLAVLQPENLSGDLDDFVDGVHEELIAQLAQIASLKVIARTLVLRYTRKKKSLREIEREFGVEALLESSVRRAADRVHLTARLIHLPSGRHVWAGSYEGELRDRLTLHADVSRSIANELKIKLAPPEETGLTPTRPGVAEIAAEPAAMDATSGRLLDAVLETVISTATAARTPSNDVPTEKTRVAILPFENLSGQPEDRWLATAFADSLTFGLQARGNLLPVSRHGTSNYPDRSRDETECLEAIDGFCRSLGARYYVDGSYHKVGDELRVVARLVEVGSGNIVMQERATGRMADLLQLEDELARRFGGSLGSEQFLTGRRLEASAAAQRMVSEARGLYASGRIEDAMETAKLVVETARGDAEAWALLAKTYGRLAGVSHFTGGARQWYQTQSLIAATRAIGLDCSSYEAHVAVALACREMGRVRPWRAAATKAIELGRRPAEAIVLLEGSYAEIVFCGYEPRGTTPLRPSYAAVRLDPTVHRSWANLAHHLMYAGRAEEGVRAAYEGLRLHPNSSVIKSQLVMILMSLRRLDEAERVLDEAVSGRRSPTLEQQGRQATIDLWRGRPDAPAALGNVLAEGPPAWQVVVAHAYIVAGMIKPALTHLEAACEADSACARWLFATRSPWWAPIHANREVLSLLGDYGAS